VEKQVSYFTDKFRALLSDLNAQNHPDLWDRYTELCGDHADALARRYTYERKPTATSYCSSVDCNREVWYSAHLCEQSNPPNWRGFHTFEQGYLYECWVKALLNATGVKYGTHTGYKLPWELPKYGRLYVGPDMSDVYVPDDDAREILGYSPLGGIIGEIKSASAAGFERMRSQGIYNGKPSYYSQCQLGMQGAGADVCVLIVICKNTGQFLEVWIERDDPYLSNLTALFVDTHSKQLDQVERGHGLAPVEVYHRGKTQPETTNPLRENKNVKGSTIGWYETINYQLTWQCSYCSYRDRCWNTTHTLTEEWDDNRLTVYAEPKE
jgi:hypothetical protein